MKKLNDTTLIVISVAAIILGVLFCLDKEIGNALDIVFGISFILFGLALAALSFYNKQSVLTKFGISGGLIIAVGIAMIVNPGLISWFIYVVVPFIFIVIGAFLLAEAFLLFFLRGEKDVTLFVVELVVGTVLLTLGILAMAIPKIQFNAFNIIEGAILILAGVYVLVTKLIVKKEEE